MTNLDVYKGIFYHISSTFSQYKFQGSDIKIKICSVMITLDVYNNIYLIVFHTMFSRMIQGASVVNICTL